MSTADDERRRCEAAVLTLVRGGEEPGPYLTPAGLAMVQWDDGELEVLWPGDCAEVLTDGDVAAILAGRPWP